MRNRRHETQIIISAVLALFSISSIALHYALPCTNVAASEDFNILLAKKIHDEIDKKISGPLLVSESMSHDPHIIKLLENEGCYTEEQLAPHIQFWLEGIQNSLEYDSAFLISDATRRYYTSKGLLPFSNPYAGKLAVWYNDFLRKNIRIDTNVAIDPLNDEQWTIFINKQMQNSDGKCLGLCGVGILLSDIQDIFESYEKEYQIKVNFVTKDGIVEVDTNTINIENDFHNAQSLYDTEDYTYQKSKDGFIITNYNKELGWYLVIEGTQCSPKKFLKKSPFIAATLLIVIFMELLSYFMLKRLEKSKRKIFSDNPEIDELTGFYNRNYFKDVYGEHGVFNTTRYKSIAVFDIDFLKEANDTMNGDEVLLKVSECARNTIGTNGDIFRWGGDEFAVLMEESPDSAYESCKLFCKQVEDSAKVTVSVGVTEVRLSDTIKKNYYRAAQGCYLVKEMGGNGVKLS